MMPVLGYEKATSGHDIALIKLDEPVPFTARIQPICLPWALAAVDLTGHVS